MPIIDVADLHKRYAGAEAVAGVSFMVAEGEVFGPLGPNGAGKTTTIGTMTTRVRPTSGRVVVDGVDVVADPVAARAPPACAGDARAVRAGGAGRRPRRQLLRRHGAAADHRPRAHARPARAVPRRADDGIVGALIILPLDSLRWFQVITLINPLTYVSEGLRAAVTTAPHLGNGWIALGLVGWTLVFGAIGLRGFERRAVD